MLQTVFNRSVMHENTRKNFYDVIKGALHLLHRLRVYVSYIFPGDVHVHLGECNYWCAYETREG